MPAASIARDAKFVAGVPSKRGWDRALAELSAAATAGGLRREDSAEKVYIYEEAQEGVSRRLFTDSSDRPTIYERKTRMKVRPVLVVAVLLVLLVLLVLRLVVVVVVLRLVVVLLLLLLLTPPHL